MNKTATASSTGRRPTTLVLGGLALVAVAFVVTFGRPSPSAVERLDSRLARAVQEATADAADDGVTIHVTSGWRSYAHQERLFQAAVSRYGSEAEAARWVARPGTSAHESGDAVDVGPADVEAWLSAHGASYGLCQIYDNEPWHFELRPKAVRHGCPARYDDPTQDPRLLR